MEENTTLGAISMVRGSPIKIISGKCGRINLGRDFTEKPRGMASRTPQIIHLRKFFLVKWPGCDYASEEQLYLHVSDGNYGCSLIYDFDKERKDRIEFPSLSTSKLLKELGWICSVNCVKEGR